MRKRKAFAAAVPYTIPILAGFLFLGAAYGVLMNRHGYGPLWSGLVSLCVFAGSMQYVGVTLLTGVFNPFYALALTLMVNARHLFYGVAMLDTFRSAGKKKPYLIFALCDETFSVLCSAKVPEGVDEGWFRFFIAMLDQLYWIMGTVLGGILGNFLPFELKGLDFVLTALFVVIFINQWQAEKQHAPHIIGVLCSVLCLVVFGAENFLLPAMGLILAALLALRSRIENKGEAMQ